jgi:putative endonuclease
VNKKLTGSQGEQLAKKLLLSKGYKFLTQNFHTPVGEVDLIFNDHNTIVFVEVKTRYSLKHGYPEEAVTPDKLTKITRTAQWYLQENHWENKLARIDVVSILLVGEDPKVIHLIDVTG